MTYPTTRQEDNHYYFTTESGIVYSVNFELIDFNNIKQDNYYLLNLNIETKHKTIPSDKRVAETVVSIINDFISADNKYCIFTCDTSDGRELARFRKFDAWYQKYNDGSYLKYDKIVVGKSSHKKHYTSIILKHNRTSYDAIEWYENWLDNFSK